MTELEQENVGPRPITQHLATVADGSIHTTVGTDVQELEGVSQR